MDRSRFRRRVQWLSCGLVLAIEGVLLSLVLHLLIDWPRQPATAALASTLFVPLATAVSFLPSRPRADRLLVGLVVTAGVTLMTAATYVIVVVGLRDVPDTSDRRVLGLSVVAAGVTVALYVASREWLARIANKLVYGERRSPEELLRTFGSRLTRAIPMDELLLQLAESLRKVLALTRAEVWTGGDGVLERQVSVPYAEPAQMGLTDGERALLTRAPVSGQAWVAVWLPALLRGRGDVQLRVAPLTHAGTLLGLIVAERSTEGDAFTDQDDRTLTDLAHQVGLALHNVQLDSALQATLDDVRKANEELQASRARIVATADAERRRIERDLHDGAQQNLVAIAVNLRLAQDVLVEDPKAAREMLERLAREVKATIAELRDFAHGVYPPLLVEAGLGPALRAAATRSPLPVDVVADGLRAHGVDTDAAVYFCCLEAMQNAAKHAPGAHITVRIWEEPGGLFFEITDDGPGFEPETAGRGHGFINMTDRLGAIGGSVRWVASPGQGCTVSGSVPLR